MPSVSHRLDRFIASRFSISKKSVRDLLVRGKVVVDGETSHMMNQVVSRFTHVMVDGEVLQNRQPAYIMLNKPKGVVSATSDGIHSTVIDLLNLPEKHELHIAGRLDFNTTGLLLLTNDGAWSRTITSPDNHIQKVYRVTLKDSVDDAMLQQYRHVFAQGIFLSPENITTRPATLVQLSDNTVELTITEGRYHQVKRMFGFFKNEVIELHRQAIGKILLDDRLPSGESRLLTHKEWSTFGN